MDENVALSAIAAHGGTHQSALVGDVQTAQILGAPAGVVHTGYPQAYGELPQAISLPHCCFAYILWILRLLGRLRALFVRLFLCIEVLRGFTYRCRSCRAAIRTRLRCGPLITICRNQLELHDPLCCVQEATAALVRQVLGDIQGQSCHQAPRSHLQEVRSPLGTHCSPGCR